jgi:hypothetical protein
MVVPLQKYINEEYQNEDKDTKDYAAEVSSY